jgi:2-keto-4-pentenoate hydratase
MVAPDPLHLIIALGPLAMYLLLMGLFNLTRRPLVTTGTRVVPIEVVPGDRVAADFSDLGPLTVSFA